MPKTLYEGDPPAPDDPLPTRLPIVRLRDAVLLPGAMIAVAVGRRKTREAIRAATEQRGVVIVAVDEEADEGAGPARGLGCVGHVAYVMSTKVAAPDLEPAWSVVLKGLFRARIDDLERGPLFAAASCERLVEGEESTSPRDVTVRLLKIAVPLVREQGLRRREARRLLTDLPAGQLVDRIISLSGFPLSTALPFLAELDPSARVARFFALPELESLER